MSDEDIIVLSDAIRSKRRLFEHSPRQKLNARVRACIAARIKERDCIVSMNERKSKENIRLLLIQRGY
jgi:hypothetical protein